MAETCRNCGERIIQTNYALGPEWEHQPAGAAFRDGLYRYCKRTKAEPLESPIRSGKSGSDQ